MKFTPQLLAPLGSDPDRLIGLLCQQAEHLQTVLTENQALRQENQQLLETLRADRKSTRLNSSHIQKSRMPSSA